jgi:hypothetical protein
MHKKPDKRSKLLQLRIELQVKAEPATFSTVVDAPRDRPGAAGTRVAIVRSLRRRRGRPNWEQHDFPPRKVGPMEAWTGACFRRPAIAPVGRGSFGERESGKVKTVMFPLFSSILSPPGVSAPAVVWNEVYAD